MDEAKIINLYLQLSIVAVILILVFIVLYTTMRIKRNQDLMRQRALQEYQQQLLKSQVELQEHTLEQIGKELHDNVGQLLGSTRMLLGITERSMPEVPASLANANETLAKAIQEIRTLSKIFNKEWLEQFSFSENLQDEIRRINSSGKVELRYSDGNDPLLLTAETQIILFRIVQEAIQNAIRHAGARYIDINVQEKSDRLLVSIRDDGSGMSEEQNARSGVGLMNMKHRTMLLGGTIEWRKAEGGGTEVVLQIPHHKSRQS